MTPILFDHFQSPTDLWKHIKSKKEGENDLVVFAEQIFDLITDLQSGKVEPSNDLRPIIISLLEDFEERSSRYRFSIIQAAKLGLAAFIDETVLNKDFILKEEWEKYPILLELLGEWHRGSKFFERLDVMLPHIDVTAEVVELYYICMLLGFRGKYAIYQQDEFPQIMQKTADALVKAGKSSNLYFEEDEK